MAKVEVFLPSLVRKNKNISKLSIEASNLKELLDQLVKNDYVDKDKLFDEKGELKRLINIYINGKIERRLDANLNEGDEVSFIPTVAGG
ncbi:MAG: MoaD/ThiS family protein [Thermoproteota archaeon]|jgi:Molybdopterin converting factor, small subunit